MPRAKNKSPGLVDSWGRPNNRKLEDVSCPVCLRVFKPRASTTKFCSRPCLWSTNGKSAKKKNSQWKNAKGYIDERIWIDDSTCLRIKQHRRIMQEHLGRLLLPTEDVHHINGIKHDNRIENLEVLSHADHSKEHLSRLPTNKGKKLKLSEQERKSRSDRMKSKQLWVIGHLVMKSKKRV